MSTTQHPLTDEQMCAIQAAPGDFFTRLRAAFDAGREHERTQSRPAEVTTEAIRREVEYAVRTAAAHGYAKGKWGADRSEPIQALIESASTALTAVLAVATPAAADPLARTLLGVPAGHGAPHHDAGQIRPDDYVAQVDRAGPIRRGIAHHQDEDGDWLSKGGMAITWAAARSDRPDALTVWPAPTPPAVEVEMPTEFGDVILNPRWSRRSYTRAVHLGEGVWAAEITPGAQVYTHLVRDLRSATLPDGTRARRDGEHEDGTPRFVKVEDDQ